MGALGFIVVELEVGTACEVKLVMLGRQLEVPTVKFPTAHPRGWRRRGAGRHVVGGIDCTC